MTHWGAQCTFMLFSFIPNNGKKLNMLLNASYLNVIILFKNNYSICSFWILHNFFKMSNTESEESGFLFMPLHTKCLSHQAWQALPIGVPGTRMPQNFMFWNTRFHVFSWIFSTLGVSNSTPFNTPLLFFTFSNSSSGTTLHIFGQDFSNSTKVGFLVMMLLACSPSLCTPHHSIFSQSGILCSHAFSQLHWPCF